MAKYAGGYYAVKRGRTPGIYNSWMEAEAQVKGFPRAEHFKFRSYQEAMEYLSWPVPAAAVARVVRAEDSECFWCGQLKQQKFDVPLKQEKHPYY